MNGVNRKKVWDMWYGKCYYCGCDLEYSTFQADHFMPKEKAWAMKIPDEENLVPACPECNNCKSDLSIEEFRAKLEKYQDEILKSYKGRLLQKYSKVERKPIVFWFETV